MDGYYNIIMVNSIRHKGLLKSLKDVCNNGYDRVYQVGSLHSKNFSFQRLYAIERETSLCVPLRVPVSGLLVSWIPLTPAPPLVFRDWMKVVGVRTKNRHIHVRVGLFVFVCIFVCLLYNAEWRFILAASLVGLCCCVTPRKWSPSLPPPTRAIWGSLETSSCKWTKKSTTGVVSDMKGLVKLFCWSCTK